MTEIAYTFDITIDKMVDGEVVKEWRTNGGSEEFEEALSMIADHIKEDKERIRRALEGTSE
jgi:hypothetical protein